MSLIAFSTGDTVLNLGFVERVKALVFPDLEPENLGFPHARFIQNGLIIAQTYVPCLRNNNVNFYDESDLIIGCNVASFSGPEHSRIQAVYAFKPCGQCTRHHYWQKSVGAIMCYVDSYSKCPCRTEGDICNAIKTGEQVCDEALGGTETEFICSDRIFAKGSSDKIYLAPSFPCDYKLAIHWEGIKQHYADAELITDAEDVIDLIGLYLQGQRALRIDRDLQLHKEIMRKPEKFGDWGGTFWQAMSDMAHRCREERRIRKDHACEAIFDDSALADLGMIAYVPVDQAECEFTEPVVCTENQYVLDGVCVDCVTPTVSISTNTNSIIVGTPVTLSWSNTVPPIDSSVVTLEYDDVVTVLGNNSSGTVVVNPTENTTYLIRASTTCGTVVATVGVTVAAAPCLCPDGLPDCLQITEALPFTLNCGPPHRGAADESAWDGTIPRVSDCRWEVELTDPPGIDGFFITYGISAGPFGVVVELIACNPYVYEMTFKTRDVDNEDFIFWKGLCQNLPIGTYVSEGYGVGQIDGICTPSTNYSLTGCFDTPCTPPEIRFDPPAGAVVNFPTLVFIHSTNDDDIIVYSVDGGATYIPYTGPFSLGFDQTLSAQSFTLAGCVGAITQASYVDDGEQLDFDFICDLQDKAGVFGVFSPNGNDDYHWRITVTRPTAWQFLRATIYETNASGVWVTGQAWATINPIFPVEMSPNPFAVYPLVLFNDVTQLNSAYGEPVVASYPNGTQVLHGYGQPAIALTGYFRLEFRMDEGGAPFTIYKLIPHTCPECPAVAKPSLTIECEGAVTLTGTVPAGAQYRIRRAEMPTCGYGIFADVSTGFSLNGQISYTETVTPCCDYSYIISAYCGETSAWVDSSAVTLHAPCESECDCNSAVCSELLNVYYIEDFAGIATAVGGCSIWGDCDTVVTNDPFPGATEGCNGECPIWDGSYSRADATCVWNANAYGTTTFNGTHRVKSSLSRVQEGENCYWSLQFWCEDGIGGQVEYRKATGNNPVGEYTLFADACSAQAAFPPTVAIIEL